MRIFGRTAVLLATVCISAVCGRAQAPDTPATLSGSRLEVILAIAFAREAPIGLEILDWDALDTPISIRWDNNTGARTAIERVIGRDSGLVVNESNGVLLVTSPAIPDNILNTGIAAFGQNRGSLNMLDWALHSSLEQTVDHRPPRGVAGTLSTPTGTPWIGPLNMQHSSVRTILCRIVSASPGGGLWLADGAVRRGDSLESPLWKIIAYSQDRTIALNELEAFVVRRKDRARRPKAR
ncbi:MAG: hypothetical protein R2748_27305 [Bryobacterales bacterium]